MGFFNCCHIISMNPTEPQMDIETKDSTSKDTGLVKITVLVG